MSEYVLGIDLDNTIIDYNALFHALALERGLIDNSILVDKTAVRDAVRKVHSDIVWQKLQVQAYGHELHRALLFPFVHKALDWLCQQGITLYIISHKTEYAHIDTSHSVNLRESAYRFLQEQEIFSFIPRENVFFCESMEEKCTVIGNMRCTDFVDDLPEFLSYPSFPQAVHKIMFSPQGSEFSHVSAFSILRSFEALPLFFTPQVDKTRVIGGRNSRVWRWQSPMGTVAIKDVLQVQSDVRQRDAAEWQAWCFLEEHKINKQPRALIKDTRRKQIISTWLEGVQPQKVENNDIEELATFFKELYSLRAYACILPPASDACFSLHALDIHIQKRIHSLLNTKPQQGLEVEYKKLDIFLQDRLLPIYNNSIALAKKLFTENSIDLYAEISIPLRMPSPSDFGLHNTLRTDEGLKFIDFEYFGQDDPVKLLCDTLLHPAVPFLESEQQTFFDLVYQKCKFFNNDEDFILRFTAYFPLWQIKWACILLNEFLPSIHDRRKNISEDSILSAHVLQKQLQKAEQLLQKTTPCVKNRK